VVPDAPVVQPLAPQTAPGSFTVTITVVAVPGYTVTLYDNGSRIGSNTTGTFTVTLGVGSHSLTATQTATVSGQLYTSSASAAVALTVYAAPSAPSISSVTAGTASRGAVVSGRGVANGVVELYEGSTLVGTTTADGSGNWTATLSVLPVGKHTLTARIQDQRSGFWSGLGSSFTATVVPDAPVVLPVGTQTAPGSYTVTVTVVGAPGSSYALYDNGVKIGTSTTGTFTVTLAPGSHSLTATQTATVNGVGYTSTAGGAVGVVVWGTVATPTISSSPTNVVAGDSFSVSGRGVSGDVVELYAGSTLVGTATVDWRGNWTASVDATLLPLGAVTLTALQREPGSPFASSPRTVVVNVFAQPAAPSIDPVPTPSATWSRVSVPVSGLGAAGQTVTLYVDGRSAGTAVVDGTGHWTATVSLSYGTHWLAATQSPASGIVSAPSGTVYVTVPRG
jgi:hypothetical protein